jgi:hypothetical protein
MVTAIAWVAIEPLGGMLSGDSDECGRVSLPGRSHIAPGDPAKELILRLKGELGKGGASNSPGLGVKRIKRLAIRWKKRLKIAVKLAKNIVSGASLGPARVLIRWNQSIHKRTQRGAVQFGQHRSLSLWRKKQAANQDSTAWAERVA